MKAILAAALMSSLVLVIVAVGQVPAPKPAAAPDYKPTHEQSLELENLQLKAQLAQHRLQDAQTTFQQSLVDLTQKAEQVKKDNHWDPKTQFNPNDVTFSAPPPEPPKPAEAPKPDKETKKP